MQHSWRAPDSRWRQTLFKVLDIYQQLFIARVCDMRVASSMYLCRAVRLLRFDMRHELHDAALEFGCYYSCYVPGDVQGV